MKLFRRKYPCHFCGKNFLIGELMYISIFTKSNDPSMVTVKSGMACVNCQPIRREHFRMSTLNIIKPNDVLEG